MISLEKATLDDAGALHALQVKCFAPLLEKYNDHETNPACETIEKTFERINNPQRGFYKILKERILVGGMVIRRTGLQSLFLGPIFIDPAFQNQKIAQESLKLMEIEFPSIIHFELAAIFEEKKSIYLYEKMGYVATGDFRLLNNNLKIILFKKMRCLT